LIRIDNQDKRDFYLAEAIKNGWTTRQIERQIYSNLWERLLMSNDKEAVLAVAFIATIVAGEYKLYLPTERQLMEEVKKVSIPPSHSHPVSL
jgi:hypothetical protein